MRVNLAISNEYVPECMGNRDLPEDEQVTVTYRFMTASQEEQYSTMYLRREGDDDFGMTVKTHAVGIWTNCVTAVSGLTDQDGKPITNPAQVLEVPGIYEMVSEVAAVIKRGLTEIDSKN